MKKLVIAVLIILPFLLVVVVAFSGKIIGDVNYVGVTGVEIEGLKSGGEVLSGGGVAELQRGREYELLYRVLPQNASNSNVRVTAEEGVEVVKRGDGYFITGRTEGATAAITVTTDENAKIDDISVRVIDEVVTSVTFLRRELTLRVTERSKLEVEIVSPTAPVQEVVFTANGEAVAVDGNGVATALKAGTAEITVCLKADPSIGDVCRVTVLDELPELYFDVPDPAAYFTTAAVLDLRELLVVKPPLGEESLEFGYSQAKNCVLAGSVVTFSDRTGQITVTVTAKTGDKVYSAKITVYYMA